MILNHTRLARAIWFVLYQRWSGYPLRIVSDRTADALELADHDAVVRHMASRAVRLMPRVRFSQPQGE